MITGPVIPLHMLAGTIVGWGILSPIAKRKGWAPGAVGDWHEGSRGWTLWIALSALIMDCLINLLWMIANLRTVRDTFAFIWTWMHSNSRKFVFNGTDQQRITNINYTNPAEARVARHVQIANHPVTDVTDQRRSHQFQPSESEQRSPNTRLSTRNLVFGLLAATVLCIIAITITFDKDVPIVVILLAIMLSFFLSVMSIRAMGQTDFSPVSGLGKLGSSK